MRAREQARAVRPARASAATLTTRWPRRRDRGPHRPRRQRRSRCSNSLQALQRVEQSAGRPVGGHWSRQTRQGAHVSSVRSAAVRLSCCRVLEQQAQRGAETARSRLGPIEQAAQELVSERPEPGPRRPPRLGPPESPPTADRVTEATLGGSFSDPRLPAAEGRRRGSRSRPCAHQLVAPDTTPPKLCGRCLRHSAAMSVMNRLYPPSSTSQEISGTSC